MGRTTSLQGFSRFWSTVFPAISLKFYRKRAPASGMSQSRFGTWEITARGDHGSYGPSCRPQRRLVAIAGSLREMAALPNNPHFRAKHCIVTPQIVWASKEARRRLLNTAIAKLRAFLDGLRSTS